MIEGLAHLLTELAIGIAEIPHNQAPGAEGVGTPLLAEAGEHQH